MLIIVPITQVIKNILILYLCTEPSKYNGYLNYELRDQNHASPFDAEDILRWELMSKWYLPPTSGVIRVIYLKSFRNKRKSQFCS